MQTYLWQCGHCGETGEGTDDKPHTHDCPLAKQRRAEVSRRRWSELGPERGSRVRKKREPEVREDKPDQLGHGDRSNPLSVADIS